MKKKSYKDQMLAQLKRDGQIDKKATIDDFKIHMEFGEKIIRIEGEITTQTAVDVEAQLAAFAEADPTEPLIVSIDSPGGDMTAGYRIVDSLLMATPPDGIIGVVTGMACSAAAYIIASLPKRFIYPSAFLMFHNMSTFIHGDSPTLFSNAVAGEKLSQRMYKLIEERSGKTPLEIKTLLAHEWYLMAEEAVETGFIDAILEKVSFNAPVRIEKETVYTVKSYHSKNILNDSDDDFEGRKNGTKKDSRLSSRDLSHLCLRRVSEWS